MISVAIRVCLRPSRLQRHHGGSSPLYCTRHCLNRSPSVSSSFQNTFLNRDHRTLVWFPLGLLFTCVTQELEPTKVLFFCRGAFTKKKRKSHWMYVDIWANLFCRGGFLSSSAVIHVRGVGGRLVHRGSVKHPAEANAAGYSPLCWQQPLKSAFSNPSAALLKQYHLHFFVLPRRFFFPSLLLCTLTLHRYISHSFFSRSLPLFKWFLRCI